MSSASSSLRWRRGTLTTSTTLQQRGMDLDHQILPFLCRLHRHQRPRCLPLQSSSTRLPPALSIAMDDR
ncbi:unnamed protein product [Linum trigynum]|uniref:Uncharacterized protein n=1 Tax=Linum trigynum TaxID=586398 RepID=A0AAV2F5B2_9ROSI